MAGDESKAASKIHIISNAAAWDSKLEEAKSSGKIVSISDNLRTFLFSLPAHTFFVCV